MDGFDVIKEINGQEKEEKEKEKDIKNKKIFNKFNFKFIKNMHLSLNSTIVIVALIFGISYFCVEKMKLNNADKKRIIQQEQEEKKRIEQKKGYLECMLDVSNNYIANWNSACKTLKRKNDCSLPVYKAEQIETWRNQGEQECMNLLKLEAF